MPTKVLTPEQTRLLEEYIFITQQTPSLIVMENAGRWMAERVAQDLRAGAYVLVVCGTGNNGGDGFVVARHLAMQGITPIVWLIGSTDDLKGDALTMYRALTGSGIPVHVILDERVIPAYRRQLQYIDAIVDALFGIGLNREVRGVYRAIIRMMNSLPAPVYSVDIPSGVDARSGQQLGDAVHARSTVTFFHYKPGHLLFPGRNYAGELSVVPLTPVNFFAKEVRSQYMELMLPRDVRTMISPRKPDAHKGDFGKAIVVSGSVGLSGATAMCARAAARTGVGLLTVAMPSSVANVLWNRLPEVMTHPIAERNGMVCEESLQDVARLLKGKTCACVGPGLGRGKSVLPLVELMLAQSIPVVVDADAINALEGRLDILSNARADVIITPHPGEMARLIGCDIEEVMADPVKKARQLAQRCNIIVLLKGATSVITEPRGGITFNISGGPKLSKGGSGDVLSGIILALLAQGLSTYNAARYGALVLGMAAECVNKNEKGVIASDIIEAIPDALSY